MTDKTDSVTHQNPRTKKSRHYCFLVIDVKNFNNGSTVIFRTMMATRMKSFFAIVALSVLSTTRKDVGTALALSTTATSSYAKAVSNARKLGGAEDLVVSEACLGTMTFGVQNSQEDANEQLDYARSVGCNFIDTAELYPVPLTAPEWKAGTTEIMVGNYLKKIGPSERDQLVVATKIAGFFPNSPVAAARSYPEDPIYPLPQGRLDSKSVKDACHASLRRLQTDRIDLMQIHWPDRYIPSFGLTTFHHERKRDDSIPILETAQALKELIDDGKIRYIGLSNESTFGVCEWIRACEQLGIRDKLVSIQNSYSLLDRRFDSELAEACDHYNIGLLPWSVLAGGLLSGKYSSPAVTSSPNYKGLSATSGSRFNKYPEYMQRWAPSSASPATLRATEEYAQIATEIGMTPSELAIAFVRTRQFVAKNGSVIVGATTLDQLKENLAPFVNDQPVQLGADVLKRIDEVHMKSRDPCCSL